MADQFLAEIRMFAGNFAPVGWALCNGQLLPISQNTALFSLIGTSYGGDGKTNFALPNLQAAMPLGSGSGPGLTPRDVGERGGSAAVTLLTTQLPSHNHLAHAVAAPGTTSSPSTASWAEPRVGRAPEAAYAPLPNTALHPQALSVAGANQPHNNLPPYTVVTFIIALQGIFPSRP
ncbi:phage tail protein [Rathayibacter soli]|uniref:phage tail protein n=1 Tax=Rathayibacter soli TaxID=3144168 RepID=UPI0027E413BF|nr:tail fiber protein [Glaciibacter superstes]